MLDPVPRTWCERRLKLAGKPSCPRTPLNPRTCLLSAFLLALSFACLTTSCSWLPWMPGLPRRLAPLAGCLVASVCLPGCQAAWLPGRRTGWLNGSLAHWLIGSLAHWLIGSLAHWLIGSLAGLARGPAAACLSVSRSITSPWGHPRRLGHPPSKPCHVHISWSTYNLQSGMGHRSHCWLTAERIHSRCNCWQKLRKLRQQAKALCPS